jgi:hypothetical protein
MDGPMRAIGRLLMAGGAFFMSVTVAAILEPWLQSIGIDIRAETTSVIGTGLIGVFAFTTGLLLRRRASEAMLAKSLGTANVAQIGSGPVEGPVKRVDHIRDSERR